MLHAVLLIAGLVGSNIFMTFAWYAHLRDLSAKPWYLAALVSWGIALFEYLLQVPANRAGHQVFTISQLKLIQEVITMLEDVAKVEREPIMEGRKNMSAVLAPK